MRGTVGVRYSPTADGTVAFNLHRGSTVGILRQRNGWVQVGLPDGKSGWVESDAVQAVREAPFDRSTHRFEVINSNAAPPGEAGDQRP
jgi:SH3-like domain-containing protein